jgi:hypothetical protein
MEKGDRNILTQNHSESDRRKNRLGEVPERPLEKGDNTREAAALEKIDADLDKKLMNNIEMKYSQWIPPERLAAARQELPEIQNKAAFESELKERFPAEGESAEQIQGYYTGRDVRVRRTTEVPTTLAHERFHQVSHPDAREKMGNHLYEGMTEDLANEEFRSLKLYRYERTENGTYKVLPPREVYPRETETLRLLRSQIPESCFNEAYFKGDTTRLEAFVDHHHKKGTWNEVRTLLNRAETDDKALEKARDLLKSR